MFGWTQFNLLPGVSLGKDLTYVLGIYIYCEHSEIQIIVCLDLINYLTYVQKNVPDFKHNFGAVNSGEEVTKMFFSILETFCTELRRILFVDLRLSAIL